MKNEIVAKAKEFFAKKENGAVNKVYLTSDGNLFRVRHYADNWAVALSDKAVVEIGRGEVEVEVEGKTKTEVEGKIEVEAEGKVEVEGKTEEEDEKPGLVKRYIELYDTKPNHLMGIPKLKAAIAAKEQG